MTILHTTAYQTLNHSNRQSIRQRLITKAISLITRVIAQPEPVAKCVENTGTFSKGKSPEDEHSDIALSSAQLKETTESQKANPVTSTPETSEIPQNRKEQHITIDAGKQGISYRTLFGDYLKGAKHIEMTDPYIRNFYQARNLMEFLELVMELKAPAEEVFVHLTTVEDYDLIKANKLKNYLDKIESEMLTVGIKFSYAFDNSSNLHARHITNDTGWKISLDRGLDIFQPYNMTDAFQLMHRHQEVRPTKAFEVTYIKV